jgi:hypothetical protein
MMFAVHLLAVWVLANALVVVLLERAGAQRESINKREGSGRNERHLSRM